MAIFQNSYVKNITIGDNVRFVNNSMFRAFAFCYNFNSPVTIPNGVTNINGCFGLCHNFNQPVNIPNGGTHLISFMWSCQLFNHPINIPDSVLYMTDAFNNCISLNSPVVIGNNVQGLINAFDNCINMSQNITIYSPNVNNVKAMLRGKSNSKRINIICPENSTTYTKLINTSASYSMFNASVTWDNQVANSGYIYNAKRNVYIYPVNFAAEEG